MGFGPSERRATRLRRSRFAAGLVDTHVHINDPGRASWEGFATATRAAAAGGVTTLIDMPLNCSPETTSVEALEAKRAAAAGHCLVDWATWGGVVGHEGTVGNEADISGLVAAGVPGFKCFLIDSGIDGFAWSDEAQLRKALALLEDSGLPLLAHAEVAGPVVEAAARLNSEPADWRQYATYLASRPDEAELRGDRAACPAGRGIRSHISISSIWLRRGRSLFSRQRANLD